jgi:hypothetical protein
METGDMGGFLFFRSLEPAAGRSLFGNLTMPKELRQRPHQG